MTLQQKPAAVYRVWSLTLEDGRTATQTTGADYMTKEQFAELLPTLFIGHRVKSFEPYHDNIYHQISTGKIPFVI